MLEIELDKLDSNVVDRYNQFSEQVDTLLSKYEAEDKERLEIIASIIGLEKSDLGWKKTDVSNDSIKSVKNGDIDFEKLKQDVDWNMGISLKSDNSSREVPISLLLAYEYCLASEKITGGRVKFEEMAKKLFSGVQKFRIGNPVPGIDDECLYEKTLNDETAIPVTSKLYNIVI